MVCLEFKLTVFIKGEINLDECMEGDHLALDKYMRNKEENHPWHRTRLSQQTWLKMSGNTDLVMRDLQERYGSDPPPPPLDPLLWKSHFPLTPPFENCFFPIAMDFR